MSPLDRLLEAERPACPSPETIAAWEDLLVASEGLLARHRTTPPTSTRSTP